MDLSRATLRPGTVRAVGPKNTIKVSAPGLFSAEDSPENLPPVKLFSPTAANSITSVKELDEVWVLSFDDNPEALYWMRKDDSFDAEEDRKALDDLDEKEKAMQPGKAPEVVFNKNDKGSQGSLYFSEESGMVMKKDKSYVNIEKGGDINMAIDYPGRAIKIAKEGITIGGSDAAKPQPAVLGENLQDVIDLLTEAIATIQGAAKKSPYTMQIALALEPLTTKLQNQASAICSSNVKIG